MDNGSIPQHLAHLTWYPGHCAWARDTYGAHVHGFGAKPSIAARLGADGQPDRLVCQSADLHQISLRGAVLQCADFIEANLRYADLRDADLRHAKFTGADLSHADLTGSDLSGADLSGAHLRYAKFARANLENACLDFASADWADFRGANLRQASLGETALQYAWLQNANLDLARLPSPTMMLLARWGALRDETVLELMRFDAACHPDPTAFDRWSAGRDCPYGECSVRRAAHFYESKDLWIPGPSLRPYDLMKMVLDERCPAWDAERINEFREAFPRWEE